MKFTCSRDLYRPGVRQRVFEKAVNRRANKLMEEYREKAEKMDKLLDGGDKNRVRRRLDQFGQLVVGQFNEVSEILTSCSS